MAADADADADAGARPKKRQEVRISVQGGGGAGGLLFLGGALAAIGAAFLFRRFQANKAAEEPVAGDEEEEEAGNDGRKGLQSLVSLIEDEAGGGDSEIRRTSESFPTVGDGRTSKSSPIVGDGEPQCQTETEESKADVAIEEGLEATARVVATDVLEEPEAAADAEVEESLTESTEEEEEEEMEVEDETRSSSVDSSAEAIWPAELIGGEEEDEALPVKLQEKPEEPQQIVLPTASMKEEGPSPAAAVMVASEKSGRSRLLVLLMALLLAFGIVSFAHRLAGN